MNTAAHFPVPQLDSAPSPDDRTSRPKLAAVGLNYGAHALQRHFANGNAFFALGGVFDRDHSRTAEVARKFGVVPYSSLEHLLADDSLEAVALFTPPHDRAEIIRTILRAGKHVLTTKPFEMDPAAAASVLREAADLGLAVHSNSPTPSYPADLARILDWQAVHELGRIIGAHGEVFGSNHEKSDGSWLDDPRRCPLAPMFRLGIYLINDLSLLMAPPAEVRALSSRVRTGRPTPDNATLSIRYEDGALATLYASLCVSDGDAYRNSLTLHFERGSIYRNTGVQAHQPGEAVLSLVTGERTKRQAQETVTVQADPQNDYRWDWFAAAIRGETLPKAVSHDQILAGLKVVEMMARAENESSL